MGISRQLRSVLRHSLAGYAWRQLKARRFERALAELGIVDVDGVTLDIAGLSLPMKRIIVEGRYEAAEIAICREIIVPGERILEIGSAIGCLGLFCFTLGATRVASVEPNPEIAERLRRNYLLNGRTAEVIEAALAAQDGAAQLHTGSDFWIDSIVAQGSGRKTVAVRAMSFASILAAAGGDFTALFCDVEGAETLLPWNAVPKQIGKVLIEIHPDITGVARAYDVLHGLLLEGFTVAHTQGQVFGLVRRELPHAHPGRR